MSSNWNDNTSPQTGDWEHDNNATDATQDDAASVLDSKPPRPELPFEHREAPIAPWVERTNYDYEAFDNGTTGDWDGNAQVYEWDGEEGEVGPAHPDLEVVLFGQPHERDPQGLDFSNIANIDVLQEGMARIDPIKSFKTAQLHPVMVRNIELCGYSTPTPIQRYCIPAVKMGHDMIAIAQTGSGKTAAYLIPIINQLMGKAKKLAAPRPEPRLIDSGVHPGVTAEPLVVIVCPARELAVQIFNEARKFCYRTMLRPAVVYGGGPLGEQIAQLKKGCDVLIASPGRLVDFMERPHILTLRRVKYMVVDEADEMLHADWEEVFTKILSGGEQEEGNIKYMLFSATFPTEIRKLARSHLAESHVRIRVGRIGSTHQNIKQEIIWVDHFEKKRALLDLLYSLEPGRTIVFVNTKRTADEIDDFLWHEKMPCTSMHADRTQREREDSMRAFRNGTAPILVTTGVSARGIDVKNVRHVINYDLPSVDHGGITEYIHRIGRTARIGHNGTATSFYTERDEPLAEVLTKTLLETNQEVPEFFAEHIPEGVDPKDFKFEPESDEEDDGNDDDDVADSWGGDTGTGIAAAGDGVADTTSTADATWGGDNRTTATSAKDDAGGWNNSGGSADW